MKTSSLAALPLAFALACNAPPAPKAAAPVPVPAPAPVAAPAPAPAPAPAASGVEGTAPAAAGPAVKDLGGGYKDAKWGMTPAQVETLFGAAKLKEDDAALPGRLSYVVFALKDDGKETPRELVTYYLDGKLFRATLRPNFTATFAAGFESLEKALLAKYGPADGRSTPDAPSYGLGWEDATTRIELRVPVLKKEDAVARGLADRRVFAETSVSYASKPHVLVAEEAIRQLKPAVPAAPAAK